jgi:hypothetical protein
MDYMATLQSLAKAHKVKIDIRPAMDRDGAWANAETRTINLPDATDERGYFTALHEMGHLINPQEPPSEDDDLFAANLNRLTGAITKRVLQNEARAWDFALSQYPNPSREVAKHALACLDTYRFNMEAAEKDIFRLRLKLVWAEAPEKFTTSEYIKSQIGIPAEFERAEAKLQSLAGPVSPAFLKQFAASKLSKGNPHAYTPQEKEKYGLG